MLPARPLLLALAALVCSFGCERTPEPSHSDTPTRAPTASAKPAPEAPIPPITRSPAPPRIVAIGDLHGDIDATRTVLKLAGAIDDKDHWVGKDLMVVQTGDQLDRGDGEHAILDLLDRVAEEAKAAHGAVLVLDGNHEVMNVSLDFRYVTPHGFADFESVPGADTNPRLATLPAADRARGSEFAPGGPMAKRLAKRPIIAVVGDTVFVHGGVLPKHVRYGIDRMNREVSAWMEGAAPSPPSIVTAEDGPIWTRLYSGAPGESDCKVLREALALIGAKRMVVGHTVQRGGINAACGGQVWRIDVGLSKFYGGKPEVLEIAGDQVRPIGAK